MKLIYKLYFCMPLCVLLLIALFLFVTASQAQSINQSFPTPITANEISGKISARDVGDARLTTYFYVFNATQGDVFINVVTKNLNGDIDVFTADNLRPLAKITLYADASDSETGRVIYFRQPAKLILRIEGRTPNDDAATYRIKFAGSFAPAQIAENSEAELPIVKSENQTDVRVNSVGTIIDIKPKPTPKPKEVVAETKSEKKTKINQSTKNDEVSEKQLTTEKELNAEKDKSIENQNETKPALIVTNELPEKETAEVENQAKNNSSVENKNETTEAAADKTKNESVVKTESKANKKPKPVKPLPPAALENIRLIISFKDGTQIERQMSEVIKFGIDKGVLTVILRDGTISRYSLLDIEKTTIE